MEFWKERTALKSVCAREDNSRTNSTENTSANTPMEDFQVVLVGCFLTLLLVIFHKMVSAFIFLFHHQCVHDGVSKFFFVIICFLVLWPFIMSLFLFLFAHPKENTGYYTQAIILGWLYLLSLVSQRDGGTNEFVS